MSRTVTQAFAKFLEDITATEYQANTLIPARKTGAIKILQKAFPSDSATPFSFASLMGSAAKNTIIRPFDDVDVLAVFSAGNGGWDKYQPDSRKFLYRVRESYNGYSAQQVGARGQAVRVFFEHGGHVDVAPVFRFKDSRYLLPAGDGTWLFTQPTVANSWFSTKDRELNGRLAPLVRLLKMWNGAHSKRFRSFHLETMTASTFKSLGTLQQESLEKFFQWAPKRIDVKDPGGESGSLSTYMSTTLRSEAIQSLTRAAATAQEARTAEIQGDHYEAKKLWRRILGDDFPIN
ncbi:hypothetical protein OK351_17420 [Glutamicibacter sp. MNS18]|uniref:SMODS domain-containing nucleotidyltransferase n=1 Tax=Glutamicibacter sp. MNS18 TaxID=2989817 RepID=UPI002236A755|nr:hypothetical protein [Glutamicibacter sp. MNS18]MCW4467263.1 hypothetical protein [Glutamicibacter sp. MNS18]